MRKLFIDEMPQRGVSLDTETHLITDEHPAPKLVLGSEARVDMDVIERIQSGQAPDVSIDEWMPGHLLTKDQVVDTFVNLLSDPDKVITGANLPFDLCVLAMEMIRRGLDPFPVIFRALREGRVFDLQAAQALDAIAGGHLDCDPRTGQKLRNPTTGKPARYSLDMCTLLNLDRSNAKENDEFRLRYGEFDGMPLDQLPEKARQYPVDDVQNAHENVLAQCGHIPKVVPHHTWNDEGVCSECGSDKVSDRCWATRPHRNLLNLADQVFTTVCLQLGAIWGFQVDQSKVDVIERYARRRRDRLLPEFIEAGLVRANGKENRAFLKKKIAEAHGSRQPCPVCSGSGKIPHPKPRLLQCSSCRGRCVPWKKGGKLENPTVASCDACSSTGKIPDPKHMATCSNKPGADDVDEDEDEGGSADQVTCDGTGLLLSSSVPRSEKGGIAYGGDSLHETGDELLMAYGDLQEDGKWLKDYIPYLRRARVPVAGHGEKCPYANRKRGSRIPPCDCEGPWRSIRLILYPKALLETGRVSYSGYIQLFPRWPGFKYKNEDGVTEYIPSFRECIVPPGARYEVLEVADDYVLREGEEFVQ